MSYRFSSQPRRLFGSAVAFLLILLAGATLPTMSAVAQDAPEKPVRAVSLHLGGQYLLGQEAEYLAGGELTDENQNGRLDQSELDVRRSRTTFLQPQFGVTLRFRSPEE